MFRLYVAWVLFALDLAVKVRLIRNRQFIRQPLYKLLMNTSRLALSTEPPPLLESPAMKLSHSPGKLKSRLEVPPYS
jgi:hypothetical protein